MEGFIYIAINVSSKELLKIGKTTKEPDERAKQLSASTGVADDYIIAYKCFVKDITSSENLVHETLKEFRFNAKREFFKLPLKDAVRIIDGLLKTNEITINTSPLEDWWQKLDKVWQSIFKKAISIRKDPDLDRLEKIVELDELDCGGKKIINLKPILIFKNLKKLNCRDTKVSNLEPLSNIKKLQELDVSHTDIKSLEPLNNLINLQIISCSFTNVDNLEPIWNLPRLKELDCINTKVSNEERKRFKEEHPQCKVRMRL